MVPVVVVEDTELLLPGQGPPDVKVDEGEVVSQREIGRRGRGQPH